MNRRPIDQGRRKFLITSFYGTAGLTLAMYLPGCGKEEQPLPVPGADPGDESATGQAEFEANAFVRIAPDSRVTVIIKHLEMGQGTYTGLATLVAEELDAAWEQVVAEGAPANPELYKNLFWGSQGTGGSTAMANSFTQMRQAGATARHLLVQAAASKWQVLAEEITVDQGVVRHEAGQRQARFGELLELAAQQPVPEEVFLKEPEAFKLIGRFVLRKDNRSKINGSARFTQDIRLPNMLVAVVAHPPRFGARVKGFEAGKTRAIPGVRQVVQIPTGVAVLATDTWSAMKGRDALEVEWDESGAFRLGSNAIMDDYKKRAREPGSVAHKVGDSGKALASTRQSIEAAYEFPYLAHATMEPLNCVIKRTSEGCEIWNGVQSQTRDQQAVADLFGLKPEQVKINMLFAGGSFGRRSNPDSDYVLEAANIVKAINGIAPVKLVWTREDDMRAGYFRPLYYHKVKAGLDTGGKPVAWEHRIVGQSVLGRDDLDPTSVEGVANLPYAVPNITVDLITTKLPVPVQWWRSIGSTHTAFAVETFIDRLARAAGEDPLAYRRALLKEHPRHLGVLDLAAEKAGWGTPLPAGRGRGIAVHESFNSYVAQVAEVTLNEDRSFTVDRVVIAVDCGLAVNPDVIRAQMEGGMGFGLSPALMSEITLKDGVVEQSNYHDFRMIGIDQMPKVEVHIVNSSAAPTGVGEPATPVIAPAVANALSALTGQNFDRLPLQILT